MLKHFDLDKIKGKIVNNGIHEREIKVLSSPLSSIKRDHFSVGVSIIGSGKIHEEHKHDENEELIVVLEGEGLAQIAGEEFKIYPGKVIGLEKSEPHKFVNIGDGNLKLLWIYSPPGVEKKFLTKTN